jgi:hypothetical protein
MATKRSVSVFYGTARMNLKDFEPLQKSYRNTKGEQTPIDYDPSRLDSIIFARMGTSPPDGISYEVTDPLKRTDVPILVSVQDIKLDKPLQISRHHMGDPSKPYTGAPKKAFLSDELAGKVLEDAVKANPRLKNRLEEIFNYASHDRSYLPTHDYASHDRSYLPTREDYDNARRKCLREHKRKEGKEEIYTDDLLDTIEGNVKRAGKELAANWRSVTEENILIWSQEERA